MPRAVQVLLPNQIWPYYMHILYRFVYVFEQLTLFFLLAATKTDKCTQTNHLTTGKPNRNPPEYHQREIYQIR